MDGKHGVSPIAFAADLLADEQSFIREVHRNWTERARPFLTMPAKMVEESSPNFSASRPDFIRWCGEHQPREDKSC